MLPFHLFQVMKIYITIIILLLANSVIAQPFNEYAKNWATYFGGQGIRFISSVVDSEGNIIAIADDAHSINQIIQDENYWNQFATNPNMLYNNTIPPTISTHILQSLIVKFSPNGELLESGYLPFQTYKMRIDNYDNIYIIAQTELDNLATAGAWQTTAVNPANTIITKLNPDFSTNWCTYFPGSGCNDICFDSELNIYGVGQTDISDSITTANVFQPNFITEYNSNNHLYNNGYIFKLNNDGQLQWATYFGVGTHSFAIAYLNDEIITSFTWGDNDDSLSQYNSYYYTPNAYQQDVSRQIITKFNATTGERTYGTYLGNDGLAVTHITCDTENFYFLGIAIDELDSDLISPDGYQPNIGGSFDLYLGKFDTNVNPIWGTYIGGSDYEQTNFQENFSFKNNALYFSGITYSNEFNLSPNTYQNNNNGYGDQLMMKFSTDDARAELIWGSFFGGDNQEFYGSIVPVSDDTFYIVGNTLSQTSIATADSYQQNISFHPSYPNINFGNGFVAKFAPEDDLSVDDFNENSFSIFPNPAKDKVTIIGNFHQNSTIELYNVLGQRVLEEKVNFGSEKTLNLSNIQSGTYFLSITNNNKNSSKHKLIVK
ncbi:hypothetical protein CDL10_06230 [Avrilella dinanensis]|uniref:Secretion system C-terminal sorting domain-containing protein n=2 Tax=Avrilella dinanensis TaxID=2008672 RepID=A0A2M9R611_9FLAO|nr:hypothetical protein CDL10_06230 [Avrilella dinanensis]